MVARLVISMGIIFAVGSVVLCAMDKMPSEAVATLAGVTVKGIFDWVSAIKKGQGSEAA